MMKQLTLKPAKASFAVLMLLFATLSLLGRPALVRAQAPMGYQDNFDSDTVGSLAPKFVNKGSANFVVNTAGPVSSPNSFGETSVVDGDIAELTGVSAGVGMCVQYTQIVHAGSGNEDSNIAPMLALDAAGQNGYLGNFNFGNSNFGIYKMTSGSFGQSTLTVSGSTAFGPFADSSKVWVKEDYDGAGTLKYKIWAYSAAEPSSWLGQVVDSAPITTAGYMGLRAGILGTFPSPQIDDLHFGPSGSVFTLTPPVVTPATSTAIHKSFDQWYPPSAGSTEEICNVSSGWHEFVVTGTSSVSEQFDMASPVIPVGIRWSVDGGPYQNASTAASVSLATGLAAGPHDFKVWVPYLPQTSDYWVNLASVVKLASVTTDAGSTVSAPTGLPALKVLVYTDSRGGQGGMMDSTLGWPYLLGQALNMETGVRALASMGWATDNGTPAQTGNIVPFYTPNNDSQSAWNKYDSSHSLLTGGVFSTPPDMIVVMFGINDTRAGTTDAAVTNSVTGWLPSVRAAAGPACKILVLPDFSGDKAGAVQSAVGSYKAGAADANTLFVPVPTNPALSDNGPSALSDDGAHPNAQGQAIEAATIAADIRQALGSTAASPLVPARQPSRGR